MPSPHDPNSLPHPGLSYVDAVRETLPKSLRIGYSPDLGYAVVQSDVAAAVEDGLRVFEQPRPSRRAHHRRAAAARARVGAARRRSRSASQLYQLLPEREGEFGRAFLAGVEAGLRDDARAVWGRRRSCARASTHWCADVFERVDLLVTPTVPFDPPPAEGPVPEETEGRRQVLAGVGAFTIPFNLSWHPAATVRVGLSRAGLPMGLQIVGPRHRDDLVLHAARAFERERPWHPDWPTTWKARAAVSR